MLSLKAIRIAAKAISEAGGELHYSDVARHLGVETERLCNFIHYCGYDHKVAFVQDHLFPGLVLMHAADKLRQRGEYVTRQALAKELGKCVQCISMIFKRHPDYAEAIGVISGHEANRRRRKLLYATLVPEIVAEKGKVTVSELSRQAGHKASVIGRDLGREGIQRLLQSVLCND